MLRLKFGAVLMIVLVTALVMASSALAQDPTRAQYGGIPDNHGADPGGFLPFTGTDLIALAAVSLALATTGLALRRLAEPRDS
jgi:hypothetical protein